MLVVDSTMADDLDRQPHRRDSMRMRLVLGFALALVLGGCSPRPQVTGVSDINAYLQRFWNRPVTLEGTVVRVDANPEGSTSGSYLLKDDTDENGIIVSTRLLPAPGENWRVSGVVIQDVEDAHLVLLRETDRSPVGNPVFLYLMIGAGALALILIVALVVVLVRKPAPQPVAAPPLAAQWQPQHDDATIPFHGSVADDATVTFEYWGHRFDVVEGPDQGKSVQIGVSPFNVGRSGGRANNLELSDRTVSRSQCAIRRHPKTGEFTVEHQGGTNETYVDGKPIQVAVLQDGTRLRMGSTVVQFTRDRN